MKKLVPQAIVFAFLIALFGIVLQPSLAFSSSSGQSAYPPPQSTASTETVPGIFVTPSPQPTIVPTYSSAAKAAMAMIAKSKGIPASSLIIVNNWAVNYPNLGRKFEAVTLLDGRPNGSFYKLLVDLDSGQISEDTSSIDTAEENARIQKYGKLQETLYERLRTAQDSDSVTVTIWVVAKAGQSLTDLQSSAIATVAAEYPEAQAAVRAGGKPMDVTDPGLAKRIYQSYLDIIDSDIAQRTQPLVTALKALGVEPRTSAGLPAVTATLTKADVVTIALRDDVGQIALSEEQYIPQLNNAVPSDRAPAVWARGFDGTGATIAILEPGNVDFTYNTPACPNSFNCFQHPASVIRYAVSGVTNHATLVASDAASNNYPFHGVAECVNGSWTPVVRV